MNHKAIRNLYPNACIIDDTEGVFDKDGNKIQIDINLINQEVERLNNYESSIEYKKQRAREYPSIGDQLDALWKGGETAAEMLAKVQAVKAKYPKPE